MGFDLFAGDDGAPDDSAPIPEQTGDLSAPPMWRAGPRGWLKPGDTGALPHNLEAEQALLGSLMFERDVIWQLPEDFGPESFYEPLHGRLFEIIKRQIDVGMTADPTMLLHHFEDDGAFHEMGGLRYLADLVDRSPPSVNAGQYAVTIHDLALRRQLMETASSIFWGAADTTRPATSHLEDAEGHLLGLRSLSHGVEMVDAETASQMVIDHLEADESTLGGVSTGLRPLDLQIGQMMPGELILLAGRPGMGKSSLAAVIALNAARPDLVLHNPNLSERDRQELHLTLPPAVGVLFISGEMQVKQSTWRLLAGVAFQLFGSAAPTYSQIKRKRCSPEQIQMVREAKKVWDSSPIIQVKRTGLKLSQVRSMARRQAAKWARKGIKLGLVVADHGGLFQPEDPYRMSEYEAQSQIAKGSKTLAGDLGIPMMVLLQLSRKTEDRDDKRPQLADLRSSGQWEENADTVLLAYREAYYAQKEKEPIDNGAGGAMVKWADWDRRRKSKALAVILGKTRDTEGGEVELWCDIGHHAILGMEPEPVGQLFGFDDGRPGIDFSKVRQPGGSDA